MKPAIKTLTIIFVLVVLMFIMFYMYQYAVDSQYRIDVTEAKNRIQNNEVDLILDVRTDLELKTLGFYPGSVHIQSADLESEMAKKYPNKDIKIIAYCNSGQRARLATEKLQKMGYKNSAYIATTYLSLL